MQSEVESNPTWPRQYTGFFQCFNRGEYFQAHEVLEELWLKVRHAPVGNFYKGLIQLAGAFVHVQKQRSGPALALLALAAKNLAGYPEGYQGLEVGKVLALVGEWQLRLDPHWAQESFPVPILQGPGPAI